MSDALCNCQRVGQDWEHQCWFVVLCFIYVLRWWPRELWNRRLGSFAISTLCKTEHFLNAHIEEHSSLLSYIWSKGWTSQNASLTFLYCSIVCILGQYNTMGDSKTVCIMQIMKQRIRVNLCGVKNCVSVRKGVFSTGDISHTLSLGDGEAEE